MTMKSRKARNGTVLWRNPKDKRDVQVTFEDANFEWDQLLAHFQLTKGVSRNVELTSSFHGSYATVYKALETLLENLDFVLDAPLLTTQVKRDLQKCRTDVHFVLNLLEDIY